MMNDEVSSFDIHHSSFMASTAFPIQVSAKPLTIALDAMGGDFSPKNEVLGALEAVKARNGKLKILLVGVRSEIEQELSRAGASENELIEIVGATEVIGMEDEPVAALRQK